MKEPISLSTGKRKQEVGIENYTGNTTLTLSLFVITVNPMKNTEEQDTNTHQCLLACAVGKVLNA